MADRKTSPFRKSTKDTDGDGLPDAAERKIGTDPELWDSDGDGLSDFAEGKLRLDANNPDSDGDGWEDGYEIGVGTNPKSAYGKDGRGAYTEKQQRDLQKKPAPKDDHDRDRVPDKEEKDFWKTDPRHGDSDGDGIGDGIEIMRGTDPHDVDTDDNDRSDLDQLELGRPASEPSGTKTDWRERGRKGPFGDADDPDADGEVVAVARKVSDDEVAVDGELVADLEAELARGEAELVEGRLLDGGIYDEPLAGEPLDDGAFDVEVMAETDVLVDEPVVALADADAGDQAYGLGTELDDAVVDDVGFDETAQA